VIDWNSDGKKDLLIGYKEGKIFYYENTNSDNAPQFNNGGETLTYGSFVSDFGFNATPFVIDWNNDSRKDLLVGTSEGFIKYFENTGSDNAPCIYRFHQYQGYKHHLDVGATATPWVADYNAGWLS